MTKTNAITRVTGRSTDDRVEEFTTRELLHAIGIGMSEADLEQYKKTHAESIVEQFRTAVEGRE